jgi:hypothetical protein
MSVVTVVSTNDTLCCQEAFGRLLRPYLGSTATAVLCADTAVVCADLNPFSRNFCREERGRSRTPKLCGNRRDGASITSYSSSSDTSYSSTKSPSSPSNPGGQYGRGAKRSTSAYRVDKIQPMSNNKPQTNNQGHFKIVGLGTSTAKPLTEKKKPKGTDGKSRGSQNRTKKEGRSSRPERGLPPTKPSAKKKKPAGNEGKSRDNQNRTKKESRSSSSFSTRSRYASSGKGKKKITRPGRDLPPTTNISHLVEVDSNLRRGRTPSRESPGRRRRSRERTMSTRQFAQRGTDIESIPTNTTVKVKNEPSGRRWGFGSRGSLRVDQKN